jgi:hypothetical protein
MNKKVTLVIATVVALTNAATANVALQWKATGGFFSDNAGNGTGVGFMQTLGLANAYVQLIFAGADAAIDLPTAGGGISDDDVVLQSGSVSFIAPGYGDGNYGTYNQSSTFNGNVYIRVFGAATAGAISAGTGLNGTLYYNSPLRLITDGGAVPSPVAVEANTDTTNGNFMNNQTYFVVPEPSTYAFLGLGAVLLAVRRLRRS